MACIIHVRVADFTQTPVGRYIHEGPHSGEAYRKNILSDEFKQAMGSGQKLLINIDGLNACPSSFFNEAIFGLVEEYGITLETLMSIIKIDSTNPRLAESVKNYIDPRYTREQVLGST